MADFDWKKLVAGVAPALGTVLAGPLAGAAIAELAGALLGNKDASEADLAAALSTGRLGPEQIVAIKQAENALTIELARIEQAREASAFGDKQGAREMQVAVRSWIPGALAVFVTIGFFGILVGLMYGTLSTNNDALLIMLGSLGTAWTGIIAYYFGSSAGSARKDELAAGATPEPVKIKPSKLG